MLELQRNNIEGERTTVQKAIKELNLKSFKLTKAQNLTTINKQQCVSCAKKLLRKFSAKKNDSKWQWARIVDIDFSGIFTIEGFQNSKDDVVYTKNLSEIPADLKEAPKIKYPSGVTFWGGISTKCLIPQDGSINFT